MKTKTKATRSGKTAKKATTKARKGPPRKRRNSGANVELRQQAVVVNKLAACMVSTAEMLKSRAQPLDFVIPTVLRGTVTALVGPGGVGKSGFALQTAISVAIGRDAYNLWGDPDAPVAIKKGEVLYISAEDGKEVVTNRVKVACKRLTRAQRRNAIENLQWFFPAAVLRNECPPRPVGARLRVGHGRTGSRDHLYGKSGSCVIPLGHHVCHQGAQN